jgi:hypothetical protein
MKRLAAVSIAALAVVGTAGAQVGTRPFEHAIRPGKIAEECFKLPAGGTVGYAFEATAPVDFNIHYHRGNDVFYPVKSDGVRNDDRRFTAPSAEEYCLMWTNASKEALTVKGRLTP